MNQLIQITPLDINGQQTNSVNARELHQALGVKKKFADWIKPKLKDTMLDEGTDYLTVPQKGIGGKFDSIEYILTLDTAKHIALMSRTAKGKEVRAYFIEVEKQSISHPSTDKVIITTLEAVANSMTHLSEGMTQLIGFMASIEERVNKLERGNQTTINITPPPPIAQKATRKSVMLQAMLQLVEINPGINQSQLMNLFGTRKDDKSTLRLLREADGTLWQTYRQGNQILYYPIEYHNHNY